MTVPEPPPFTGQPPGAEPRLYALLAVEVRPGHVAYYHLELDHESGACTIELDRGDPDAIYVADQLGPLGYVHTAPMHISATLSGTVVSDRPDYRPPTRTPATVGENALTGVTRALPAGGPHA